MTRDIHGSHAERRARWRRAIRRLAWATVAIALANMALMWVLSRPVFQPFVGSGVPVVGVAASTALYVLALCVPLIQRSAVNDLRLPRLDGVPREAWAQPVERSSTLVNGALKGLAGTAFLLLLAGIGMSQSNGRNLQGILVLLAVAMWAAMLVFGITRAARFAARNRASTPSTTAPASRAVCAFWNENPYISPFSSVKWQKSPDSETCCQALSSFRFEFSTTLLVDGTHPTTR